MRIAIAGGGTGGHISPAIAVAEALRNREPEVVLHFLGTPRPVDARMYARFGDAFHVLHPPRADRDRHASLLLLPFRAIASLAEARRLLKRLRADVLFATGGYPSFFPVLAARSLGIPCIIHESNGVPGRANRLAARFATEVLTGFRIAGAGFRRPVLHVGNPIRPSLTRMEKASAAASLGLAGGRPTVLFLGGSQGAQALNALAPSAPPEVNVILQCGAVDEERMRSACAGLPAVRIVGFVDDPSMLYSAADLAVARAGAMTTAELSWYRLPAVLVPYPSAAGDHQRVNAGEIASAGGARVLEQDRIGEDLWRLVTSLLADPGALAAMKTSLAAAMPDNPADAIAARVLALAGGSRPDAGRERGDDA